MEPQKLNFLRRAWRVVRIPVYVVVALFVAIIIFDIPHYIEKTKTEEVVNKIHAEKLTLKDVMGENLPPEPDSALVDATVAGVDANGNGIRDDVELAIFKLHPDSARIRAAELQYAMELQTELTLVFNSETWKAAVFEESRGSGCISQLYPRTDLKKLINDPIALKKELEGSKITEVRVKEVEDLEYSNNMRKTEQKRVDSYITSFGLANKDFCDIASSTLPN